MAIQEMERVDEHMGKTDVLSLSLETTIQFVDGQQTLSFRDEYSNAFAPISPESRPLAQDSKHMAEDVIALHDHNNTVVSISPKIVQSPRSWSGQIELKSICATSLSAGVAGLAARIGDPRTCILFLTLITCAVISSALVRWALTSTKSFAIRTAAFFAAILILLEAYLLMVLSLSP